MQSHGNGGVSTPRAGRSRPTFVGANGRLAGHSEALGDDWRRPWETMRDRATYAMSFASALATDALLDLSGTFIQAMHNGTADNPPAHGAEGTIRLDDVYHLHRLAHGAHAAIVQSVCSLKPTQRNALQRSLGMCAVFAIALLILVHLAFVAPISQIAAAGNLSRAIYEAGRAELGDNTVFHENPSIVVHLEITNASWPQQWLQPHITWLQQRAHGMYSENEVVRPQELTGAQLGGTASRNSHWHDSGVHSQEALEAHGIVHVPVVGGHQATSIHTHDQERPMLPSATLANGTQSTVSVGSVLLPRFADLAAWAFACAFPTPRYDVFVGTADFPEVQDWLEVQSIMTRKALGVAVVQLKISARDPAFFGPLWAQELLSALRLYDVYVLHALPVHFAHMLMLDTADVGVAAFRQSTLKVVSLSSHRPHTFDLTRILTLWTQDACQNFLIRILSAIMAFPLVWVAMLVSSAFLRRFAILSARMGIYAAYTLRQTRRYAFVAEPLRRINNYSSNELLELWTQWATAAVLTCWLLARCTQSNAAWLAFTLSYMVAEYWGIVHVRTQQSRWIYPRAVALLYGGAILYATWWPLCPLWLLLFALTTSQFWLMLVLLCRFDCFASLPERPPHRLLYRALMLPAAPLSRTRQPVVYPQAERSRFQNIVREQATCTRPYRPCAGQHCVESVSVSASVSERTAPLETRFANAGI